jgi:hypothetical protein
MRPLSRYRGRCRIVKAAVKVKCRGRGVEAAVEVSRPAHVLVLLLKTAVEAEVEAEVEASRPRYYS